MSRTLHEAKIIKSVIKTKKDLKKTYKNDGKPKFILIGESNKGNFNEFISFYKKNKFNARVKFLNEGSMSDYLRTVYFEHSDGSFEIVNFTVSVGISKANNKIYTKEIKNSSIKYKNEKFWHLANNTVRPLTYRKLNIFINNCEYGSNSKIKDIFQNKFAWFKSFKSNAFFNTLPFNTIIKHNIYSENDLYMYLFGVSSKTADLIIYSKAFEFSPNSTVVRNWNKSKKVLINIDKMTDDLLGVNFLNACRMANILGYKIDCSWSEEELIKQMKKWEQEINKIMSEVKTRLRFKITHDFKEFANLFNYTLLNTKSKAKLAGLSDEIIDEYVEYTAKGDGVFLMINGVIIFLEKIKITKTELLHLIENNNNSYGLDCDTVATFLPNLRYIFNVKQIFDGINGVKLPLGFIEEIQSNIIKFLQSYDQFRPDIFDVEPVFSPIDTDIEVHNDIF